MRIWIGSLALTLLAGCSLPASLVPGEPNISKTSAKSPKDYAACLLPLWQKDVAKTSQTSISNGYRITAPSIITSVFTKYPTAFANCMLDPFIQNQVCYTALTVSILSLRLYSIDQRNR
mgnify:CR=1 FL=1